MPPTCTSFTDVHIEQCDSNSKFTNKDAACYTKNGTVTLNLGGMTTTATKMRFWEPSDPNTTCSSLSLGASDPAGKTGWTNEEAYSTTKTWALRSGDGDKKVCVYLSNGGGTTQCGGMIKLDTVPPTCQVQGPLSAYANPTSSYGYNAYGYDNQSVGFSQAAFIPTASDGTNWTNLCSANSSSCSGSTTFAKNNYHSYYVVCNARDKADNRCLGDPWCWDGLAPAKSCTGYSDCGATDKIKVWIIPDPPIVALNPGCVAGSSHPSVGLSLSSEGDEFQYYAYKSSDCTGTQIENSGWRTGWAASVYTFTSSLANYTGPVSWKARSRWTSDTNQYENWSSCSNFQVDSAASNPSVSCIRQGPGTNAGSCKFNCSWTPNSDSSCANDPFTYKESFTDTTGGSWVRPGTSTMDDVYDSLTNTIIDNVANGATLTANVRAKDSLGNASPGWASTSIDCNTNPPWCEGATISPASPQKKNTAISFSSTAKDTAGLSSCILSINGTTVSTAGLSGTSNACNLSWTPTADGSYTYQTTITDTDNLSSACQSGSYCIDTQKPGVPPGRKLTCAWDGTANGYRVTYEWSPVADNGCAGLSTTPYWSQISTSSSVDATGGFSSVPDWNNTWENVTKRTSSGSSGGFGAGTTVYAHVRSRDKLDNQSDWSDISSVAIGPTTCTGQTPPTISCSVNNNAITFNWTYSDPAVSNYWLQASTGNSVNADGSFVTALPSPPDNHWVSGLTDTLTGLNYNTTYYAHVTGWGAGPWSSIVSCKTAAPPTTPQPSCSCAANGASITYRWTPSSYYDYHLQVGTSTTRSADGSLAQANVFNTWVGAGLTEKTVAGLSPDTPYYAVIRGTLDNTYTTHTDWGPTLPTAAISCTCPAMSGPTITKTCSSLSGDQLTLNWSGNSGFTSFWVQVNQRTSSDTPTARAPYDPGDAYMDGSLLSANTYNSGWTTDSSVTLTISPNTKYDYIIIGKTAGGTVSAWNTAWPSDPNDVTCLTSDIGTYNSSVFVDKGNAPYTDPSQNLGCAVNASGQCTGCEANDGAWCKGFDLGTYNNGMAREPGLCGARALQLGSGATPNRLNSADQGLLDLADRTSTADGSSGQYMVKCYTYDDAAGFKLWGSALPNYSCQVVRTEIGNASYRGGRGKISLQVMGRFPEWLSQDPNYCTAGNPWPCNSWQTCQADINPTDNPNLFADDGVTFVGGQITCNFSSGLLSPARFEVRPNDVLYSCSWGGYNLPPRSYTTCGSGYPYCSDYPATLSETAPTSSNPWPGYFEMNWGFFGGETGRSFTVKVEAGSDYNSTTTNPRTVTINKSSATAGSPFGFNINATPTPTPIPTQAPWKQLKDADFQGSTNLNNPIPVAPLDYDSGAANSAYFVLNQGGVVTAPQVNIKTNNAAAQVSSPNWQVNTYNFTQSFDKSIFLNYVRSRKKYKTITSLSEIAADGIYVLNVGGATPLSVTVSQLPDYNFVLIADGAAGVSIDSDIKTSDYGKSLAIIADLIKINPSVSEINAILIAPQINTDNGAAVDQGLKIVGNLVTAQLNTNRFQDTTNQKPAVYIVTDPKKYLGLLPYLSIDLYDWRQLQ